MADKGKLGGSTTDDRLEESGRRRARASFAKLAPLGDDRWLLAACTAIYLALVFDHVTRFPLYFFCDEAAAGVDARAILTNGTDVFGERWPVFFRGLGDYALSFSVYWAVPFVYGFGLSEFAIRIATACASLIGVFSVYGLARFLFDVRPAWITILLFATAPTWYLHSRTGFEYVLATSFFLAFALFYVLTLVRAGAWVVAAAASAAASFYSYTPARGWISVALVLLALFNARENLRHWRALCIGLGVLVVLLTPALYVHWKHPEVAMKRLHAVNFDTFVQKSRHQQIAQIAGSYAQALNPRFWYVPQRPGTSSPRDRHLIAGLPRLPAWSAPFALVGLAMLLWHPLRLEHRTIVALLIAAIFPSSVVGFDDARAMPVGTLLLLLSSIGIGRAWRLLEGRPRLERVARFASIALLALQAARLRGYVFEVAPRAYADYGFYGVQMGAPQVFGWIAGHHRSYGRIVVSDLSFNGGEILIPFFLKGEAERKTVIEDFARLCRPGDPPPIDTLYVGRPSAFEDLKDHGCPILANVVSTIGDPVDRPLFAMATLARQPGFEQWLVREEERRRELVRTMVPRTSGSLAVAHPEFDIGEARAMFDGDLTTLARSARINPARIHIELSAVDLHEITVVLSHTGSADLSVRTHSATGDLGWGSRRFSGAHGELITFSFPAPEAVRGATELEVEVHVTDMDENGYVHINEISWK